MIADCVASSKMLSEESSKELIEKLGKLVSFYQRREIKRRVIVSGRAKSTNNSILYNVSKISEAISSRKNIEFRYFQYNMNKEREYKHDGKVYRVHPKFLLYENNTYYLLAYEDGYEFKTFRVDRMDSVKSIDSAEFGYDPHPDRSFRLDIKAFSKSTFGMVHGEIKEVTMLFKKEMVDTVIDKFGEDVSIKPVDETHFRIKVPVAVSSQFFAWVFGLGDNVMIEQPLSVVKQMMDMLKERHKAYREGHSKAIYNVKNPQK